MGRLARHFLFGKGHIGPAAMPSAGKREQKGEEGAQRQGGTKAGEKAKRQAHDLAAGRLGSEPNSMPRLTTVE